MNFRESYFEFKSYQGGYAREAGLHLLTGDCRENCASALTKNWVSLIVFIIAGTFLGKVVGGPWRASAGAWWDLAAARREVECLRLELGVAARALVHGLLTAGRRDRVTSGLLSSRPLSGKSR